MSAKVLFYRASFFVALLAIVKTLACVASKLQSAHIIHLYRDSISVAEADVKKRGRKLKDYAIYIECKSVW